MADNNAANWGAALGGLIGAAFAIKITDDLLFETRRKIKRKRRLKSIFSY